MGESPGAEISVFGSELEAFSVETPGGRIQIRWDLEASATPNAQLAFFAEFLATTGVYESWVNSCPLSYGPGNASRKRDVLGTWFLSILAGQHRYAHITALRGDGVSPQILGMRKIVCEDTLRRALARMTNSGYALESMAQIYRDRADAENGFDELKNQWGWGGFTTQDIERCQTSARAVALVYNWWSWYCRAAKPEVRMEAITSRALLLAAVGRATKHAGQTTLYLTPMHAAKTNLMLLIANIRAALNHVRRVAEQSPTADRWKTLLDYIVAKIIPRRPQKLLETCALLAG
jgi:hypothetical protein